MKRQIGPEADKNKEKREKGKKKFKKIRKEGKLDT